MQPKHLLLWIFTALSFSSGAQTRDFTKVDELARSIPYKYGQDIPSLANALTKGLVTEYDKARSFFVWIADNIKYDVKTFENRKDMEPEKALALQEPLHVLKSKKAVCMGYSNLFLALCASVGIDGILVGGISKNSNGHVAGSTHAWCLIKADGNWGLIDPTWGAGDVDMEEGKYRERIKEAYFFMPPELFIANHYPADPLFQLLPSPLTLQEFKQSTPAAADLATQKKAGNPRKGYASLADSLQAFLLQDSVEQQLHVANRVLDLDPDSNYGLYMLGKYHYEVGFRYMQVFQEKMMPVQQTGKGMTRAWCDEEIDLLNHSKKQMEKSMAVFKRSTATDNYSGSIRTFRRSAEAAIKTINQNLESMNNMRVRLK